MTSQPEKLPMDTICVPLDNIGISRSKLLSVHTQLIIVEKIFCFCCCVLLAPTSSALFKARCYIMDDFSIEFLDDGWVKIEMKELQREIDESGVSNIEEFLRKRLERWREVEVNIAVTGDSGAGKSSFINAIRE